MKEQITPKEFDKLSLEEQYFYIPFYKKYKKVRKKDYCEECGHFTGYYYEKRGIGKPIGFRYSVQRGIWMPKIIEILMKPNILLNRLNENKRNNTSKK